MRIHTPVSPTKLLFHISNCFEEKHVLLWKRVDVTRLKSGLNETHIDKIEINKEDYKERPNKDRT